MHWPYENGSYQVAAVDDLAVFYGVHSDGMSLRGQSYDLSDEELDQSLRVGGFRLVDVAATPEGQTPFIGDFVAANGSRQLVGLELVGVAVERRRVTRVASTGSVLSRAIGSALLGGFRHRGEANGDSADDMPDASRREGESVGATERSDAQTVPVEDALPTVLRPAAQEVGEPSAEDGVCPYLRKREAAAEAVVGAAPAGSESEAARQYRCAEAQGMLVMTVSRLERLCQGGGYTACRHYRYHQRGGLEVVGTRAVSGD